ncbi:unnamed protein product [Rodentolepis nana]|uniref:Transposase n=1 Tax=Rodentolepis nana TaxID=102285 RepID=A0A0R3TDD1_RODNA|nr:unnamed protein product [Rodentolepis nana]
MDIDEGYQLTVPDFHHDSFQNGPKERLHSPNLGNIPDKDSPHSTFSWSVLKKLDAISNETINRTTAWKQSKRDTEYCYIKIYIQKQKNKKNKSM